MELYLRFSEPNPKPVDPHDFRLILQQLGITHGLMERNISEALGNPVPEVDILIARGTPPVHGKDGFVRYTVRPEEISASPKQVSEGKVDLKDLQVLYNFKKGALLAELKHHTSGIAGMSVKGEPIPPVAGKPAKIRLGTGTELSEDGRRMTAAIDGALFYRHGQVCIYPVFVVEKDLDYSVGNLNFVGTIQIRGDVLSGFKARAAADINVGGIVEAAELTAQNDIIVRGGVQGGGRAVLEADGHVHALFLNEARVFAKKSVQTRGSIIRCEIIAHDGISAYGREGAIFGGRLIASKSIDAAVAGSEIGLATHLEVGTDPSLYPKLFVLQDQLAKNSERIEQLNKKIEYFLNLQKRSVSFEAGYAEFLKSKEAVGKLEENAVSIRKKIEAMELELGLVEGSYICIREKVYPAVSIKIGQEQLLIREARPGARFVLKDGKIKANNLL